MSFQVERWSGRRSETPRTVFIGPEQKARDRYFDLAEKLRQGSVKLIDEQGRVIQRTEAPCLRTRW